MTTPKDLLQQLAMAAEAHNQFHFSGYYSQHSPDVCSIATNPHNETKNIHNRWGLPYDYNLITSIQDYINASPMHFNKHRYIAAQGPRANTFTEFWNMVVEENSSLIITVTNEREERKDYLNFKFDRYWPLSGSTTYGDVTVMLHEEQLIEEWHDGRKEKLRLRRYQVKKASFETTITHLHMENWPDNGIIHPESLVQLAHHADQNFRAGPIIVHCAAGVGRTGTFIAYHSLFHDYREQLAEQKTPLLDIPGRVHAMRKLRWGAMISDIKQYELVLDALKLSLATETR